MPSILDFIFPKKCVRCKKFGDYFCESCKGKIEFLDKPVCPVCQREVNGGKTHPRCLTRYTLDGLVVVCRYRNPVKAAIQRVKYRWIYDIGDSLVDLISLKINEFDVPKRFIIVPVPLHRKRKNWRGFNQAEILAKKLSKKFKVKYADILIRDRETNTQVGLSQDDRKNNVRGAFSIKSGVKISGENIVLVDDVYTSGATMTECSNVLKNARAKSVWGMVIALG